MADLAPTPLQHDGASGNVLQRAEPKVRVAGLIALLSPIALYLVDSYVPGVKDLGQPLNAVIDTALTGALTFAGAYLTPAVDRIDLFATQAKAELEKVSIRTIGEPATRQAETELEQWVSDLKPAGEAIVAAAESITTAAVTNADPVVAARNAEPAVLAALTDAGLRVATDAAAAAPALIATVETAIAPNVPPAVAALSDVLGVEAGAGVNQLIDALHKALAALEPAGATPTPIGDAARAAVPTAVDTLPPVPTTAPMAAVAPVTPEAPLVG